MVGPAAASPFAERPTSSSKPAVVVVCIRHLSISFLGYPSAVVQLTASLTKLDARANFSMGEEGKAVLRKAIEGRSGFELEL